MSLRSIAAGLKVLFRRKAVDREIDEELAHYIEEATRENIRAGMSAVDAERAARVRVGSSASARDEALSGRWEAGVESVLKDVQVGLRAMRRNLGFTTAAVVTIALGVGANTAMFSVMNAVLLRPLPWRDANKLVLIYTDDTRRGLQQEPTAYRTITDWQANTRAFEQIEYYSTQRVALMPNSPGADRGRARSALVSDGLFAMLGVPPLHGRTISHVDDAERSSAAVISHAMWQRWFAGAPDVVGKTLVVDDASKGGLTALTVVGVMPPGFYFPDRQTDIWTPATSHSGFDRESLERFSPSAQRWTGITRLTNDVSLEDARSDLARIGRQLGAVHPSTVPNFPGFATTLLPIGDSIVGQSVRGALWLLGSAVALVLLIACVNVANLLLARGAARQHEFAIRRALGGSRTRVARQLIIESLLLSLIGGAAGAVLAAWGTRLLASAASDFIPRIDEITADWRVLGFAAVASVLAGIAFGLAPALRLSRVDAGETLAEASRATGRVRLRRNREVLVTLECALALMLLSGAGLLLRSWAAVQSVNPGFDPSGVLAVRVEFPSEPPSMAVERTLSSVLDQTKALARVTAATHLADRVRFLPGVTDVGFVDDLFRNGSGNTTITIPGRSEGATSGELNDGSLTPSLLPLLRVPLRRGRLLTGDDVDQRVRALASPVAVVVNETFARRFFPSVDPIGQRFTAGATTATPGYEIVGVVGDMHRQGLEQRAIPEYYEPWIPLPNGRVDLLVRVVGDARDMAASVRDEVKRAMPGITVVSVSTVDAQLDDFSGLRRLQTWLLTMFAGLAVALAGVGIFGVVHFTVSERRREIGVRMALGASPAAVMKLVLQQGLRSPVLGIGIGLMSSAALTRVLSSVLFGVTATDPATFATVAAALVAVATLACWLAGRSVLRVDPVRTIRDA